MRYSQFAASLRYSQFAASVRYLQFAASVRNSQFAASVRYSQFAVSVRCLQFFDILLYCLQMILPQQLMAKIPTILLSQLAVTSELKPFLLLKVYYFDYFKHVYSENMHPENKHSLSHSYFHHLTSSRAWCNKNVC